MELNMIKLIATDLDGTLFYPKRRFRLLSTKNRKFLREYLRRDDRHVVLVSGRNFDIGHKVIRRIGSADMIACNGSVILRNEKVIEDHPMDHAEIREFLKENGDKTSAIGWVFMSDRYPMVIVPVQGGIVSHLFLRLYLMFQFAYREKFLIGEKYLRFLLEDENARIYKMMAIYGIGSKKIETARKETEKFIDAYGTRFEVLWSNQSVEFMNKGVNKANALKKIINVLELKEDEVAVVGDSGNDIPLFESFENSFVMAQAPEEVKRKAKTEIEGVYCLRDYID